MTSSKSISREYSSFRDPSGVVFEREGTLYRQINACYMPQYHRLMESGLYADLQKYRALVSHEESDIDHLSEDGALVIKPERIPFISYPYEWTFGQLKDAALLTLKLHRRAMRYDMVLKDASAYNIQFINGRAILIDTLSFDFYEEGMPWGAYGQFCRHFLAPLLLMSQVDIHLNRMLSLYIDGIPLDMADALLKGRGGFLAKQHITWHAKSVSKHAEAGKAGKDAVRNALKVLTKKSHLALIESLIVGIEKIVLPNVQTEWGDYYAHSNYTPEAAGSKGEIVHSYLKETGAQAVWDIGANDGTFSQLAIDNGGYVIAFDIDPAAAERNYTHVKKEQLHMLPLVMDITNPSPGIGFNNRERMSLDRRQKPDCIMALALVHHLAISNNLPLDMLAAWFAQLSHWLIIEFVPKEDSQVEILLATRPDIFPNYTQAGFEAAFGKFFFMQKKMLVTGSHRVLYLFEVK